MSVVKAIQPVEYVEESTFGQAESDPTMEWIGLVEDFTVSDSLDIIDVKAYTGDSERILSERSNIKNREGYAVSISYSPQNLRFLQYVTGKAGGMSRSLKSIQIGQQNEADNEYRRLLGCISESTTIAIEEDSSVEVDHSLFAIDTEEWSNSDYVGSGSHASEVDTEPLTYDDLGNIQLDNSPIDDYVSSITIEISNEIEVYYDVNSSLESEITAVKPTDRTISVELDMDFDDMSIVDLVMQFDSHRLSFDLGNYTIVLDDFQFQEVEQGMTPGALLGDSVPSASASKIKWGSTGSPPGDPTPPTKPANKLKSVSEVVGQIDEFRRDFYQVILSEVIDIDDRWGRAHDTILSSTIGISLSVRKLAPTQLFMSEVISPHDVVGDTEIKSHVSSSIVGMHDKFDSTQIIGQILTERLTYSTILPYTESTPNLQGGSGNSYWVEVNLKSDGSNSPHVTSVDYDPNANEVTVNGDVNEGTIVATVYEDVGDDGSGPHTDPNGKSYDNKDSITVQRMRNLTTKAELTRTISESSGTIPKTAIKMTRTVSEVAGIVEDIVTNLL